MKNAVRSLLQTWKRNCLLYLETHSFFFIFFYPLPMLEFLFVCLLGVSQKIVFILTKKAKLRRLQIFSNEPNIPIIACCTDFIPIPQFCETNQTKFRIYHTRAFFLFLCVLEIFHKKKLGFKQKKEEEENEKENGNNKSHICK